MSRRKSVKIPLLALLGLFLLAPAFAQKGPPKPADRSPFDALFEKALAEEKRGRFDAAEAIFKEAIDKARAKLGKDSLLFFEGLSKLADFYVRREMFIEASDLLDPVITLRNKGKSPPVPPSIAIYDDALYGISLFGIGDEEVAEAYLRKVSSIARDFLRAERRPYRPEAKPVVLALLKAEKALIELLDGQGRGDEADLVRKGLESFTKGIAYES
jgi:tetratricopeptide (TPR) repeat protein